MQDRNWPCGQGADAGQLVRGAVYLRSRLMDVASRDRFSGFADLYDANRPSPPTALGPLLASYANTPRPAVVDLGSGTGLSSRWAAAWARSVIGVEPNDEMRAIAESRPTAGVAYRAAVADATGLEDDSADAVVAVQAMHWMEPDSTLAEVARILRPGGLMAAVDADWPPVSGVADAERAWQAMHQRIRVLEGRLAGGQSADALRRPIDQRDGELADDDLVDPHRNRIMPGGLRSWSKSQHLQRMASSGWFKFVRELVLSEAVDGGVDRFIALMYSQGSYQGLRRLGIRDEDIGVSDFEQRVRAAFDQGQSLPGLSFSWRVRLGVVDGQPEEA